MIIYDGLSKGDSKKGEMFVWKPKAIQTFPLIMFSLFCQITIVPATAELRDYWPSKSHPGKIRFKTLVLVSKFEKRFPFLGIFFLFGDNRKIFFLLLLLLYFL